MPEGLRGYIEQPFRKTSLMSGPGIRKFACRGVPTTGSLSLPGHGGLFFQFTPGLVQTQPEGMDGFQGLFAGL